MSNMWTANLGRGARIEIDRDAFSDLLFENYVKEIDAAAHNAAAIAQAQLPERIMKDRIRVKEVAQTPSQWFVQSRTFPKSSLMHGLRIPVALVTADSSYAFEWEYGPLPNVRKHKRNPRWQKQYRPLITAMQQSQGREVVKFRKPRRAR